MIIQHNINSLNARNKLKANISGLKRASEKLSSGYRINRAGDDAAGLGVSEKMRTQIRGLNQAVRNSQDGINLIQTFEGALNETAAIVNRAKSLAEEAANGTYDDSIDRSAIELEYRQLCDEIDQIAKTDYNGAILLASPPSRRISDGLSGLNLKINRIINDTNAPDLDVSVVMCTDDQAILNNPKALKALRGFMEAVNNENLPMFVPEVHPDVPIDGTEGIDIYYGEKWTMGIWIGGIGEGEDMLVGDFTMMHDMLSLDDLKSFSIYFKIITHVSDKDEYGGAGFDTTDVGAIKIADIILKSAHDPIVGNNFGIDFKMDWFEEMYHYETYDDGLNYTDHLDLQIGSRSKDMVNFTFEYNSDGIGQLSSNIDCTAKGLGMDELALSNQEDANKAIDQLDYSLNKISAIRAVLGAVHNRLEHKISDITNISENLTEAESALRDTNMASEMMSSTKFNILQQAAQSMLAQANQLPQSVLSILG